MSDNGHTRLKSVFLGAMDLRGAERAIYLDEQCGGDASLRARVEGLLAAAGTQDAGGPGPTVVVPVQGAGRSNGAGATAAPGGGVGGRIGSYKLLELLGEGGFGEVYLAEQESPVRRRVALKVIKLGMDTRAVIARFEAERQALAMMDHPNIARVLDAGATGTGRPYFVMELVRGEPITAYCDSRRLSVAERLELFEQVCQAVQHAHAKGIIHRDIKPSNVLVTVVAGDKPLPKVIDFGIAKATSAPLTEQSYFTHFHAFIGTPEYMSPEQAGGSVDVDTRTDIYSLGVLLYELLTGTTPFGGEELRGAAYAEIQRILRDVDPPAPSTKLSHSAELGTIAARRHVDPKRLGLMLRGDLDWIVMKALEKDPERRYDTSSALAGDVRRYLRNEAVLAAPPSVSYRVLKTLRRHRGKVALLGVSGTAVVALAVIATVGWARAAAQERQKDLALTASERDRAAAVSARIEADKALRLAEQDRRRAESEAYVASVMAADASLRWDEPARLLERLEAASPALRGWEWDYIRARSDSSLLSYTGHRAGMFDLTVTPDGSRLVTAAADYSAMVFDAETGKMLLDYARHGGAIYSVSVAAPDGDRAATTSDGEVRVWDLLTGDDLHVFEPPAEGVTWGVARFAPGGRALYTGASDGIVRQYDTATWAQVAAFRAHDTDIIDLCISADGTLIATASADTTARTWRASDHAPVAAFVRHDRSVRTVALSPDGRRVVSTTAASSAWIWDAQEGDGLVELSDQSAWIASAVFTGDGSKVVAASGPAVVIFDAASGEELGRLRGHQNFTWAIAVSPDGSRTYSGSDDGTVRAWDVRERGAVVIPCSGSVDCAQALNPDGRRVVVPSAGHAAEVWDIETGRRVLVCGTAEEAGGSARFTPDGTRIVTEGATGGAVWDAETGARLADLIAATAIDGLFYTQNAAISYSPDGLSIVAPGGGNTAEIWDRVSGRPLKPLRGHTGSVNCAVFGPDGAVVATGSDDGTAVLWNVATGRPLHVLGGHPEPVEGVLFSADGARVATFCGDRGVRVWSTGSGDLLDTIPGDAKALPPGAQDGRGPSAERVPWAAAAAIFSPTGSRLMLPVGRERWMIRDVGRASWQPNPIGTFFVFRDDDQFFFMTEAAFSPDDSRVIKPVPFRTAVIFDAASGRELLSLRGHSSAVRSVAFTPDGRRVLTCSSGELRVWDSASSRERLAQREEAAQAAREVGPMVEQLAGEGGDWMRVRSVIAANHALTPEQRWAAHALVTEAQRRPDLELASLRRDLSQGRAAAAELGSLVARVRDLSERSPGDRVLAEDLGVALYMSGDYAGAIAAMQRAEVIAAKRREAAGEPAEGPMQPRSAAYIAMAQARLGRDAEARASLEALRSTVREHHASHPACQRCLREAEAVVAGGRGTDPRP